MDKFTKEKRIRIDNVFEKIKGNIYTRVSNLKVQGWVTKEPVDFSDRFNGIEKDLSIGESWGKLWDCGWFNFTGNISEEWKNEKIVLLIDVNGEGCLVDNNGIPIQGLTNGSSAFNRELGEPGKKVIQYIEKSKGNEKVDIWVETGCNDLFGKYSKEGTLELAYIAIENEKMKKLYYDFEFLYELFNALESKSARKASIFESLFCVTKIMKNYTKEEAIKGIDILKKELDKEAGDTSLSISAIGHAHIDLAWLWPIRETIRKGGRTFSTVIELMKRYPEYKFGASQPQLYDWIKNKYPSLYTEIKKLVKENRWEVQGGMWVESDTNIPSGESLVRQILYGKRFFKKEFNKDVKCLWLPDVFGYTASLPQILKKSGIDYFLTIKLSWNEYNEFPYHTFNWEGIDGSKVLTHMPPEGTYNSSASPKANKKIENKFIEKGISDDALMLYGIGNGGGGPGEEHLERLKRSENIQGLCPVKQEFSIDFFNRIDKNKSNYNTWVGELYLEKHQGTLTTQSQSKRYNRKLEILLRELEFICSLALINNNYEYPQDEIENIWKEVLLYQFHDILPGTSIDRVYKESLARYRKLEKSIQSLLIDAKNSLPKKNLNECDSNSKIIFNSLTWQRNEWLEIDDDWKRVSIPAMGYKIIKNARSNNDFIRSEISKNLLQNDLISIELNDNGLIKSIFDKEYNREIISKGSFVNEFAVYEDAGDAWDFDRGYYKNKYDKFKLIESKSYKDGPYAIIEQKYKYNKSILVQKISLCKGSKRLDFNTEVIWNEKHKMLRTAFPLNIKSNEVTCDIQFGTINRSTHNNTSWDKAKFEFAAHKWIDISQRDYGVAVLNDCKYGHKVNKNVIDLNLLRSTQKPGIEIDKGKHKFTYSIYPHKGDHIEGEVEKQGYELNTNLSIYDIFSSKDDLPNKKSFIDINDENIFIESVKKAEDDNNIIIRLFQKINAESFVGLKFNFDVKSVDIVNILEEKIKEIKLSDGKINLKFKPFEIHTLKLFID